MKATFVFVIAALMLYLVFTGRADKVWRALTT